MFGLNMKEPIGVKGMARVRMVELIHEIMPKNAIMISGSRALNIENVLSDWDYAVMYNSSTKASVDQLKTVLSGLGFNVDVGIASSYGWNNADEHIMRINNPTLRIDISVVSEREYKKMQKQFVQINKLLQEVKGLRELIIETKTNIKQLHPGIDGIGSSIYKGLLAMVEKH